VIGVETHQFRNGGVTIIGLHSNPQLDVDELGPPEFKSNKRFEEKRTVVLTAPAEFYVYDIRSAKSLGRSKRLRLTVDPYEPTLLAFSPAPFPQIRISMPEVLKRGSTGHAGFTFAGFEPAETPVLHLNVTDPSGKQAPYYSGNLLAPGGAADKVFNIAENAQSGKWTLQVRDVLTGQSQTRTFEVQ
jgi:hypothetical protein